MPHTAATKKANDSISDLIQRYAAAAPECRGSAEPKSSPHSKVVKRKAGTKRKKIQSHRVRGLHHGNRPFGPICPCCPDLDDCMTRHTDGSMSNTSFVTV